MDPPGKGLIQIAMILLCAGLGSAWTYFFHPKRPALYLAPRPSPPSEIDLSEVLSWEAPPVWIDVRPEAAFLAGHITGALSLDPGNVQSQLVHRMDLFIDQRNAFVLYGPAEAGASLMERLRGMGLRKVHVLRGGWEAWQAHRP